jgi:hypothetical protein
MPLVRDEGEYAYMAQLMLQGEPPYKEAYAMKFPGIYVAYAAILSVFGETDIGIRCGLIFVNATTAIVLFFIARNLGTPAAVGATHTSPVQQCPNIGIWSATSYLILSLNPSIQGITANAEHFILLPALIGILFIQQSGFFRYLFAGIFLGLAMCVKQQGMFFVIFGAVLIAMTSYQSPFKKEHWLNLATRLLIYGIGIAIPCLLFGLWLWNAGVFPNFKFWCLDYAKHYGSMWSWKDGLKHFQMIFTPIFLAQAPFFIAALCGLLVLWRRHWFWTVATFLAFSFLATTPGLIFRPHYFLLITPALALAAGCGLASLGRWMFLGTLVLFFPIVMEGKILFAKDPETASRLLYPRNAFPELRSLAFKLKKEMQKIDRIAIMGSEPQVYFYAQRRSALPYIYFYPLFETHPYATGLQKHAMALLEKSPPPRLIHIRIPTSWLVYPASDPTLLKWLPSYLERHYQKEDSIRASHLPETQEIAIYRSKSQTSHNSQK